MLELVKTVKEVKFEDKVYLLISPTKQQVIEYNKIAKEKESNPNDLLDASSELFIKLGLPQEVVNKLEIEHYTELIKYVFGSGKK